MIHVKTLAAVTMLLDAGIGATVWALLLSAETISPITQVTEWVHLAGYVVALITGVVMLFKNKTNALELFKLILEFLKK